MKKLTSHERFARIFGHREADRIPIVDAPWSTTIQRWRREGMPENVDFTEFFDLDRVAGFSIDNSPRYPVTVLEETDEYTIATSVWGVTVKRWKQATSTPQFLDFRVVSPATWAEARRLIEPAEDRIPWERLKENYPRWKAAGLWISAGLWFGFDITHSHMVGTERLLVAMIEEPEWCRDMFNFLLDVQLVMLEKVWAAGYRFDEVHWYDDMGYKHNQFFSVRTYRDLLKPAHKKAIDWAHGHDVRAHLHSCGDIRPFIPELAGIGLDALNPLEVKAGVDPLALKREFGSRMTFKGGINATLWDKPDLIEAEIRRLVPRMKESGGYIFASDHSVPDAVSLEDFRRITDLAKELGRY
ncbi:MAG TPA: uroporphyrinogen decarboxylase family protein [bacterium]|uniref:Methylcobalamin:coenzyme M methyltransferase n=1 Tax=candidate division TA06 bacterium ADurb.Bin417 TaxID=1852828 RepID=A0A1V5MKP5_UNCT6|nr:MAG: methylcobalamin:coenzyme M methyltransferase [candidate division TA06 bacterium ADurb.Bin417]HNQ35720.1 uroporphyrinogen decarboxylase family protein [bacterium]HNS49060.1 uroporphyrinogen decarboxylase family protein [bacterium]